MYLDSARQASPKQAKKGVLIQVVRRRLLIPLIHNACTNTLHIYYSIAYTTTNSHPPYTDESASQRRCILNNQEVGVIPRIGLYLYTASRLNAVKTEAISAQTERRPSCYHLHVFYYHKNSNKYPLWSVKLAIFPRIRMIFQLNCTRQRESVRMFVFLFLATLLDAKAKKKHGSRRGRTCDMETYMRVIVLPIYFGLWKLDVFLGLFLETKLAIFSYFMEEWIRDKTHVCNAIVVVL